MLVRCGVGVFCLCLFVLCDLLDCFGLFCVGLTLLGILVCVCAFGLMFGAGLEFAAWFACFWVHWLLVLLVLRLSLVCGFSF